MIIKSIKSEIIKTNKVFLWISIISMILSVAVLNVIYVYDHSFGTLKNTVLRDYIEVNNILSGEVALVMPILCIVVFAFIWTVDFEAECLNNIILGVTRRIWAISKIVVSGLMVILLFLLLGIGLTVLAICFGSREVMTVSYIKQFSLLLAAGIPMIIWILLTGLVSLSCKEFGKTVSVTLVIFLMFYIMENYFARLQGFFPTSSLIYIWGYGEMELLKKNIINVAFYTILLFILLMRKVKKEEVGS